MSVYFSTPRSQLWFLTGFFLVLIIVVTLVGNFMVSRSKVEMIGNWLRLQTCSGSLCARHRKDSSTTVQLFSLFSRLRWLGGARQHKCLSYVIDLAPQVGLFVMIPGLVHEISGAWTLGEFLCEVSTFLCKISLLSGSMVKYRFHPVGQLTTVRCVCPCPSSIWMIFRIAISYVSIVSIAPDPFCISRI